MEIEKEPLPVEILSKGIAELDNIAQWVLDWITTSGANVVALYGEMGSGKTTLTAQIAHMKQVAQTPSSPTFAIINDYTTPEGQTIHHFDFYRIKTTEEAYDFGYQEYFFSDDLCFVEWPELIEELLPENTLRIRITTVSDNVRTYTVVRHD